MESLWYSLSASELAFCKNFAVQVHDSSGLKQLRTLWTAYCIHQNMSIDTLSYDRELRQVWQALESVQVCSRRSKDSSGFRQLYG